MEALRRKGAITPLVSAERPRFLITLLPHTKEKRPVETYPEPQATKPVHEATEIQDGDSVQNPNQTFSGPLGVLNRSSGCVPPRACGEGTQPVPLLPVRRGILPVIGTSLRAVNSTQDLHETGQDYGNPPQAIGDLDIRLPRRLAQSEAELKEDTGKALEITTSLGWIVNYDKSSLSVAQKVTYLGAVIYFQRGLAFPTPGRIEAVNSGIRYIRSTLPRTASPERC